MAILSHDWSTLAARGSHTRFWSSLACGRCGGPILIEHNPPNVNPPQLVAVYPEGPENALKVAHVPEDVEHYYRDAITVLQAGVPEAAAVQLRRTLEAAVAHFKIEPYPLVKAIRQLIAKGLITTNFGEVLGHVRVLGNIGAHATDQRVEGDAAQRALRFTTQVLRNLFEIPAELAELGAAPPEESPTD